MIREVKEAIKARAMSQKKISKFNDGIEKIINLIDYVNNCMREEDVEIWSGHSVDEVLIPREFADFVYPASIRYNSADRRTADLIVRKPTEVKREGSEDKVNVTLEEKPSYADYLNACDAFRGNFKRDAVSDMVSIGSLRRHLNLSDVISKVAIDKGEGYLVSYYAGCYVPIPIKDISALFENRYLNDDAQSVLKDYIAEMRFTN